MSFKNKVPVAVIRIVENVHAVNSTLIKIVDPGSAVLKVVGTNGESDFFFTILQTNPKEGDKNVTYSVSIKPFSIMHLEKYDTEISPDQVEKSLVKWVSILKEYAKKSPLFDYSIERSYYETLGPFFDIKDPDAARAPYGIAQQKHLYQIFEDIKTNTLNVKSVKAKEDEDYVSEIIQAFTECQDNLSRETKLQVLDRLKWGLAKIIKYNRPFGEATLEKLTEGDAQQTINGGPTVSLLSGGYS